MGYPHCAFSLFSTTISVWSATRKNRVDLYIDVVILVNIFLLATSSMYSQTHINTNSLYYTSSKR